MNRTRPGRRDRCGLLHIFVISTVYKMSIRLGRRKYHEIGHLPRVRHMLQLGSPVAGALDRSPGTVRPRLHVRIMNRLRRAARRRAGG